MEIFLWYYVKIVARNEANNMIPNAESSIEVFLRRGNDRAKTIKEGS